MISYVNMKQSNAAPSKSLTDIKSVNNYILKKFPDIRVISINLQDGSEIISGTYNYAFIKRYKVFISIKNVQIAVLMLQTKVN